MVIFNVKLFGRIKRKLFKNYLYVFILSVLVICIVIFVHIISSPETMVHDFTHYMRSRYIGDYINEIENILIEPRSPPCEDPTMPLVALVTSAPHHFAQRDAIRLTWGTAQPTFFFLGIAKQDHVMQLEENLQESKLYNDIIVSGFIDTYDNLTLKTSSLLRWVSDRCARAAYVMKADDDVFVNPWLLRKKLAFYTLRNYALIGQKNVNSKPVRDQLDKWYLPPSLYSAELFPEYLGGPVYIIRGDIVSQMYERSFEIPLINLEDVYYTFLIAKESLNYNLTHERSIQTYNSWRRNDICSYWRSVALHRRTPEEIMHIWQTLYQVSINKSCD